MKKIFLASDHGGFNVKEKLKQYLVKRGYKVEDCGPFELDPNDDYPDYVIPLGKRVVKSKGFGIIACRNGQGACIAANKVKGVRAVTGFNVKEVKMARLDDNGNVLSIPADYVSWNLITRIARTFLETNFSNESRHKRRLRKISRFENNR